MDEKYSKFERARMIGARALQIARGAPLTIKTDLKDPIKIAEEEFAQGTMPLDVRRKMPIKMEIA
ncbi:MAG: DNA-directed RNA polymerase subunit K [Candidatus Aenigmarchaeota archaeon]|nr:DNA-directed RNA polymerase subunit K [Candidatus Aenigmarchaeota archaeon]